MTTKIPLEDRKTATRELFQALEDLGVSYQPHDLNDARIAARKGA